MQPEIKLVIYQKDRVIGTVKKELSEKGFVKSIEEFQVLANAAMTKLIEDFGGSGDCNMEEDSEDSDNDEEDEIVSPKKKKK